MTPTETALANILGCVALVLALLLWARAHCLLGHRPPSGLDVRWAIRWRCERCHLDQDGEMGARR